MQQHTPGQLTSTLHTLIICSYIHFPPLTPYFSPPMPLVTLSCPLLGRPTSFIPSFHSINFTILLIPKLGVRCVVPFTLNFHTKGTTFRAPNCPLFSTAKLPLPIRLGTQRKTIWRQSEGPRSFRPPNSATFPLGSHNKLPAKFLSLTCCRWCHACSLNPSQKALPHL